MLASESDTLPTLDGSGASPVLHVDDFHVFTLLATVPMLSSSGCLPTEEGGPSSPAPRYKIDKQQLELDLAELDRYLSSINSRPAESLSYAECPAKSMYDVEHSCSRLDPSDREEYLLKRALVRAASDIFELFFPLRYEHVVTLKFWGSIDRIIQTRGMRSGHLHFEQMVKEVSQLARLVKEVKSEIFSDKQVSEFITTVPHEFIQAW